MSDTSKNVIELKIILLGPAGVGKTSFTNRYIHKNYQTSSSTIGASFLLKTWKSHKIAIWDTAGEEKYRALSKYYCRGAGAVILAFDLSNKQTFDQLEHEFVPLLENTLENRVAAVVGMKSDLLVKENTGESDIQDIKTSKNENFFQTRASNLLKLLNRSSAFESLYYETSSLEGTHVDEVFESLFSIALLNPPIKKFSSNISLTSHNQNVQRCFC